MHPSGDEWTLPAGVIQDAPQDEEDSSSDSDNDDSGHIVDSDATVTLLDDELWMFAGDIWQWNNRQISEL